MGGRGKRIKKEGRKIAALPADVKAKLEKGKGDRITSKSLGLDSIKQKTAPFDRKTRTAKKNLEIEKLTISTGNLSKSKLLALESALAGGIKRNNTQPITVAPVKGKPGQYAVLGDGNNRIAYLKLVGYTGKVYVNVVSGGRRNLTFKEKAKRASKKAAK
jgi:hypothetical protein